jgi:hypothetical protein
MRYPARHRLFYIEARSRRGRMSKVSVLAALALTVFAAGVLTCSRNGRIARGDDWAMASRDSRFVESVLSAPVGDDFYGLAHAASALQIMRIQPEAELAAMAFERAVLTAWIDTSPSPAIRGRETVREAMERERHLSAGSLVGMREEAIAVAKQRRIPEAADSLAHRLAIPLAPYRAVLNADRARVSGLHPAMDAAYTRVSESSCRERGSCWRTFARSDAAGILPIIIGGGAAVGLGLAGLSRRQRRARQSPLGQDDPDRPHREDQPTETDEAPVDVDRQGAAEGAGQPTGVGRSAVVLALLSGPVGLIAIWFVAFSGDGKELAWTVLPGLLLIIGVPISVIAVLTLFLSRRG